MNEEIKRFENELKENKELADKFKAAVDKIAKENESLSKQEVLVKAAAEFGYTFSVADLERVQAEKSELSDEELENVAGGIDWCAGMVECVLTVIIDWWW